ncbi:aspartyl protease family protein [bacterium]|nr:aspartyl protease family protein [FCB group bacterium]MBL7190120.1 aspartyl protease family protein [bacterium]
MGHVKAKINIINTYDQICAEKGLITSDKIRQIEIEGLVDTGATNICLPISVIEQLGLRKAGEKEIRTANGKVIRRLFQDAWITILNRFCTQLVVELPDDCPPLIGVTILEELDLVPNPAKETLEYNPEHGDKWTGYAYTGYDPSSLIMT